MGYREARRSNASDEGGESGGLTVRVPLALKPSRRAAVPPFAVMSILNRVAALRAQGREIISLCAGEPSQGAPSDVRRRAAELMVDHTPLGYSETFGIKPLRRELAAHYRRWYAPGHR